MCMSLIALSKAISHKSVTAFTVSVTVQFVHVGSKWQLSETVRKAPGAGFPRSGIGLRWRQDIALGCLEQQG